jgi:hypothetical protein
VALLGGGTEGLPSFTPKVRPCKALSRRAVTFWL